MEGGGTVSPGRTPAERCQEGRRWGRERWARAEFAERLNPHLCQRPEGSVQSRRVGFWVNSSAPLKWVIVELCLGVTLPLRDLPSACPPISTKNPTSLGPFL